MAGGGRSEPENSEYNSIEAGIDLEQLQEYLQDYAKEESINKKIEALKDWVEKNIT